MSKESCEHCRFQIDNRCRRYAPRPKGRFVPASDLLEPVWPEALRDGWCGEFEPTPERVKGEMVGQKVPTPDKEQ